MRLLIENNQEKIGFSPAMSDTVKKSVEAALSYESFEKECEIGVTLVDNQQIRELNMQYRNIDNPTDVLSFPLIDFECEVDDPFDYDEEYLMLGDIVISLEKVVEQAEEFGHSLERELGFLCVHSTLHLLGYDHIEDKNRELMREKEEEILTSIDLLR